MPHRPSLAVRLPTVTVAALLGGTLSISCARGDDPIEPGAKGSDIGMADESLINGEFAQQGQFGSVLVMNTPDGLSCTATKIGPRHVLTAGHCVDNERGTLRPATVRGAKFEISNFVQRRRSDTSQWHSAFLAAAHTHPESQHDCLPSAPPPTPGQPATAAASCYFARSGYVPPPDVAVLVFQTDLPSQWPSARVATNRAADGDTVTLLGYGCEGGEDRPGDFAQKKYLATRILPSGDLFDARTSSTPLEAPLWPTYGTNFFLTPGVSHSSGTADFASLCAGDSGGPVFRAGTNLVVGVNSHYYAPSDSPTVSYVNAHTRLRDGAGSGDRILPWLRNLVPSSAFE